MDPQSAQVDLHELGVHLRVEWSFTSTDQPWSLPADALIVDVGEDRDQIQSKLESIAEAFPDATIALHMNVFEREIKPIYLHDGASDEKPYVIFLLRNRARMSSKMQQSQFSRIIDQCLKDPRILSIAFQATTPPGLLSFQDHASRILIALEQVTEARIVNDGHLDSVFIYGVAHDDERAEILDNYSTFTNRDLDGDNAPPQSMHPRMLAGGISRDLVDPSEYIDATQDMLGILPYASMLANVISAEDTPLPLSIGLFGEWGSGKSFFMGMLREQIRTLEETPGNCAKIAQISFNAWHYTDSNLWASLGDEIFRQLAEPHRSRGESDAEHEGRKREGRMLKEQIAAELELRDQLTAVTQQAETEAAALRRKIRETEGARMSAGSRILAALRSSETIKGGFQKVWPALGVTEAAEQGRLLADELRGTLSEADELRRMSRYRQGRVALGVAGIVLVVALCVILLAPTVQTWLTSVLTAAVVAPLATGTVMISRARAGLRKLRALAQEIHQGLADAPFAKELQELEKVEADQRVAEAQLQQVIERVGQLGRQLAELTPGRRLYAFLAERSKTEDYRGSLGLISTIRKDFERLVALLREPSHSENDPPKPVDRIVLYIDDLDRCAPAQVVEVLQAVHLLLAFDLFVVVVGVDPRWLLRSISSHYDQLIEDQPTAHRDGWRISPEDYLEKILNIPLVLPPMASGGLRQLLDSMVEPSARHADSDSTSTPPATDAAADTEPPATSRAATTAIQVEEGSQVATQLDPTQTPERPHPLFDHEVDLLARLDQLIETPRDAKRLVNLYRLVRSTRDLTETADFIDHEYQAVIVLLGAFTAHAALSGRLANALLHAPPETSWTDFLATLKPQRQSQHWTSPAIGEIADAELAAWTHLHDSLLALSNAINLPDLRVLQSWVPRVRPFSYVLPTRGR